MTGDDGAALLSAAYAMHCVPEPTFCQDLRTYSVVNVDSNHWIRAVQYEYVQTQVRLSSRDDMESICSHTMPRSAIINISQQLQRLEQTKWGFVVDRCTYDNQADWEEFMKTFQGHVTDNFEDEGPEGQALLSHLKCILIDDRERLENASKATVRSMFQQWVKSVSPESEGSNPASSDLSKTPSPRYAYCIQVNQDSLHSVLAESNGADVEGYVYLIKCRFPSRNFLPQHVREAMENDEVEMDESYDEPHEEDDNEEEEEEDGTDDS